MVMPPWDTFDYVATVPDAWQDASFQCTARLRHSLTGRGDAMADRRLVGHAPRLQVADAGPGPGADRLPVLRSRITLTSASAKDATASATSFYVDRELIAHLQPGDDVHVSLTACSCLGLSILRKGELLAAIGAVTAVDLGKDFKALVPYLLVQEAAYVFRNEDPEFAFPESPVEFIYKTRRRILFRGDCHIGQYAVLLRHGFLAGIPGLDESAAIYQTRGQIPAFVIASAGLLESDSVEIVPWPS